MSLEDLERALKANRRRRLRRQLAEFLIPLGLAAILSALLYLYMKGL